MSGMQPGFADEAGRKPALSAPDDGKKVEILLAAYNKHSAELLALENSQQTLVMILLGIFSAGIGVVDSLPVDRWSKAAVCLVALALVGFGGVYTRRRTKARGAIRGMIVDVEAALHFYEQGVYLQGRSLLPPAFMDFPKKKWLSWIYLPVILAAIGFILLVLSR